MAEELTTLGKILVIADKAYRIAGRLIEEQQNKPKISDIIEPLIVRAMMGCSNVVDVSQAAAILLKGYLVREAERANDKTEISIDPLDKLVSQMTLREMIYVIDKMIHAAEVLPQITKLDPKTMNADLYIVMDYVKSDELLPFAKSAFSVLCKYIERDMSEQSHGDADNTDDENSYGSCGEDDP